MGWFESDFFFYMSSFTGISVSSFIWKFLELFHFPDINWSSVKVFIKSPLSEKIEIIKDVISLFNSVKDKDKIIKGGPKDNNNHLNNKCDYTKNLHLFIENKGESSVNSKDVYTNSKTYKGDKDKPIKFKNGPELGYLDGTKKVDLELLTDNILDKKKKMKKSNLLIVKQH